MGDQSTSIHTPYSFEFTEGIQRTADLSRSGGFNITVRSRNVFFEKKKATLTHDIILYHSLPEKAMWNDLKIEEHQNIAGKS